MNPITVNRNYIKSIYRQISPDSHKGTRGHALLIGGSYGKIGAVSLSAKAALVAGAGLSSALLPECGYVILQTFCPEVMVITNGEKFIGEINLNINPKAIGIGSGIGTETQTQKAFAKFLETNKVPLIIDADALNILSQNKALISFLNPNTILTPHPKEFERLVGSWKSDQERIEKAVSFSTKHHVILVLKSATTLIIFEDQIFENTTGNAALATAGSGDVLTGIITSLVAQNYEPLKAAILGVYLHGKTADIALPETGNQSFIASDIIANIGKAYLSIEH